MCNAVALVFALVFALSVTAACGSGPPVPAPQPAAGKDMKAPISIEDAQRKLTPRVMALPGVVGIAQSECDGKPCIKVLVDRKTALHAAEIPSSYEGHPVVIDEIGEIRPRQPES